MALSTSQVDFLADQLVAARLNRLRSVSSLQALPADDVEAYRVQAAVVERLGDSVPAWKVGTPNRETTPNCAPILRVYDATGPIRVEPRTGLEVEIAFKLGRGFAASRTAPTRAVVEAAIKSAHVVIELCASRLADQLAAPARLQLADNGSNLGLVVGPEIRGWQTIDFKRLVTRLDRDGATLIETTGGHSTCDLVPLLTWLVGHVVTERGGLAPGTLVTCGSWMGIKWVDVPAKVRGVFDGVGALDLNLVR